MDFFTAYVSRVCFCNYFYVNFTVDLIKIEILKQLRVKSVNFDLRPLSRQARVIMNHCSPSPAEATPILQPLR